MSAVRKSFKLVVVGDTGVGKTCLFTVFATGRFPLPNEYVPVVLGGYVARHEVDGQVIDVCLWDTAGHEDYDKIRPISYYDTPVFLLCFSLVDYTSYKSVEHKWYPELTKHCPDVPIILVGTKLDLREDKELSAHNQSSVSMQEGIKMQTKNPNVVKYLECSASTNNGVKEVLDEAMRTAMLPTQQHNQKCLIA